MTRDDELETQPLSLTVSLGVSRGTPGDSSQQSFKTMIYSNCVISNKERRLRQCSVEF